VFVRHFAEVIFLADFHTIVSENGISSGHMKAHVRNHVLDEVIMTCEPLAFPTRLSDFSIGGVLEIIGL
jgi:hypothetical protein